MNESRFTLILWETIETTRPGTVKHREYQWINSQMFVLLYLFVEPLSTSFIWSKVFLLVNNCEQNHDRWNNTDQHWSNEMQCVYCLFKYFDASRQIRSDACWISIEEETRSKYIVWSKSSDSWDRTFVWGPEITYLMKNIVTNRR